jgi:mycothiol synthase
MDRIEVKRHMAAEDIDAVRDLLRVAEAADGHRPLGEHKWLDLVQGGRQGFAGLVAWEPDVDHPVGYAQLSRGQTSWGLEVVIDPQHRVPGNTVGIDLVHQAIAIVSSEGGGHLHLWVSKPRPEHDEIAAANQLARGRDLYQMRRPLPVDEPWALDTRPFQPGRDDTAWLAVNNRAFDWHPEQGGWDEATLKAREAEEWFDPEGFLLHEEDGRLAGFCWTKIHTDTDRPLGEIYVVAVDPDWQGTGLGRKLVLAGLAYLAGKGLQVGMLYVDATNRPALKLYIDLGFTIDHIDRAYVGDIAPATSS